MTIDPLSFNPLTERIIGAALKVHTVLGPGLLESAYQACLAYELRARSMNVLENQELPVAYEGIQLPCGYRLDLIVDDTVIIELKAVRMLAPVHQAQLITYLKLTKYPVGLLMNFNMVQLKNGIKRVLRPTS